MCDIINTDNNQGYASPVSFDDSIVIHVLKEAIASKKMSSTALKEKLGNNDYKAIHGNNISLESLIRICDILDITISLEFADRSSDVPNPMNKIFGTLLTKISDRAE